MTADDRDTIDRLDAYLDALAMGQPVPDPEVEVEWQVVDQQFRSLDRVPTPGRAFADRLLEDLMPTHAVLSPPRHQTLPRLNGRGNEPWPRAPRPLPASRRRWAPGQLATAAIVMLAVVGSFVAVDLGQPGQQRESPAFLPAISGIPATPQTPAPIAEFLWQSDGGPAFPLGRPTGAAVDPQGNVWVTDGANDRILIFATEGEGIFPDSGAVLEAWGTHGSGEGEFDFACYGYSYGGIAIDAAGNVYVADSGNQRIQKFGPDRRFHTSWGSEGVEDSQLLCPMAVTVDQQGRVYVSDLSGKIEVFAPDGAPLATWDEEPVSPGHLTIDGDGTIWVTDGTNAVLAFAPDGRLLTKWNALGSDDGELSSPQGIAVDAHGRIFVSDLADRVQVFAPDGAFLGAWGSPGSEPGQFANPNALALDGQGHIYVTEENGRVYKFRLLPPLGPG